jgi:hypothetical protein
MAVSYHYLEKYHLIVCKLIFTNKPFQIGHTIGGGLGGKFARAKKQRRKGKH